jgi:hypothetical protein
VRSSRHSLNTSRSFFCSSYCKSDLPCVESSVSNCYRYPSLLESSDVDGGSSVAVLTYLRRILESLDHPDMINLILHYLLALPDAETSSSSQAEPSVSAARRRKSMDLATMMATKVEISYTPLLFNLVDLIHSCLKSRNQQTVCVTLQLLAVILKRHHRYAVITLLHTEGVQGGSHRTRGAHEQEVDFLMTLAGSIGGQDNFDDLYDNILKDTMTRLEGHPCSLKLVAPKVSTNNHKLPAIPDSLPGAPRDVPLHTLSPMDPLLNTLLDVLEKFFINPVETNLSLTETIIDLAICGFVSLEGWLLRHPNRYIYDEDDDGLATPPDPTSPAFAEMGKLQAMARCRQRPQWQQSSLPRILTILEALADQVVSYRSSIPRFEELLQQRREAFQTADTIVPNPQTVRSSSKTATPIQDRTSLDDSRSASPARPTGLEGFAQRLLSEFGTPSRSGSPRGRKEVNRSSGTTSGMSGGYGLATPTSKPIPVPPREFPLNHESPSRSGLAPAFSPASHSQQDSPNFSGRGSPVASQMAAFAAVDQSILARKVALPSDDVKPIPLSFEKTDKPTNVEEPATPSGDGEQAEGSDENQPEGSDAGTPSETATPADQKLASVSHVITNVIIFQSFLLELASLVQVRAGMFNEVRFA